MGIFDNWSRNDFLDFFNLQEREQIEELEKISQLNISFDNIVLNQLTDFYLFNESKQKNIIENIVNKLDPIYVKDFFDDKNKNNFEILIKYFIENKNIFLNFLGVNVKPPNYTTNSIMDVNIIYPYYSLREYQIDCCKKIKELYLNKEQKVLLHLPTGAGKTRTAMNLVCDYLRENPKKIVLWLADTVELCDQAKEEFDKAWKFLGNRSLQSYAFYGSHDISLSGLTPGFLVAGLQKFRAENSQESQSVKLKINEFIGKVGLIVFDEAHKALANTYKTLTNQVIEGSLAECFLVGLSATPGRGLINKKSNEETEKLRDLFNNNKVSMSVAGYSSPIEYLEEKKYLAKPKFNIVNYDNSEIIYEIFGEDKDDFINNILAKSTQRNYAIINNIKNHLEEKPNSQMIIFACSVAHASELELWVSNLGVVAKRVDGGTDSKKRENYIERFKEKKIQVLINYGVLTAGFDAPCTDCVFITRPTNSLIQYLQMAGRAMRGKDSGGNDECTIYTVNDNIEEFTDLFKAFEYWNEIWK